MSSSLFEHPVIRDLLAGPTPGTRPDFHIREGVSVAVYRSARLTFRRDAIEMLPPGGILLIRVVRGAGPQYDVAMTREDFEANFGNVIRSRSWEARRSYDLLAPPAIALAFIRPRGATVEKVSSDTEHAEDRSIAPRAATRWGSA